MSSPQQFTIEPADAGSRLDKFLTAHLANLTRSQIQKLIKRSAVTINGRPAAVHRFLKAGDVIVFSPVTPSPPQAHAPPTLASTVVYEDDDLLVIEKPAGLLVHPTARQELETLTAWLQNRYPKLREVGEPHRPGIVHRLDRDVSGLMVVAKTPAAYQYLVEQFAERHVHKTYAAVVYGTFNHPSGEITLPIGRATSGKFVARPANGTNERNARTAYRVQTSADPYSLLEVKTTTGRPHQIRAHLAAIGHPIVGDREYGPSKPFHHTGKRKIKVLTLDRVLLHVTNLKFAGPDGAPHLFISSLPAIFNNFLNRGNTHTSTHSLLQ